MNKPGLIIISLILISSVPWGSFGQSRLKIVSGTDSSKLPYATIVDLSKQQMYSTNEQGEIQLHAKRGDEFQISYVGYKNAAFIYEGDEDRRVILYRDERILKPIVVSTCNKFKKITLKNFKKEKRADHFGRFAIGTRGLNEKGKIALLIENARSNARVKKFSFFRCKCWEVFFASPR